MNLVSSSGVGTTSLLVHTTSKRPLDSDTMIRNAAVCRSFLERTRAPERGRKLILAAVPSLLTSVVGSGKDKMKELAKVADAVTFGGAPLDYENGEELARNGANVVAVYGM